MGLLQHGETIHPVLDSLCIRTIYNFSYRLSGDRKVAEGVTEEVLLMHLAHQEDDVFLLKHAWEDFLKYDGCLESTGEDRVQQALLALDPELRCAVILRDVLGCSYQEISLILDKSETEVAHLISKGRRGLGKS
ncbi:sigma factor-like helix-turn-helix DNA-binding protein [Candidatus Formimonas warabiya]|uniref:RNA polymerase sigma factor 70 region 4 type 2 domain-containing protein n=1 Tax=Formimonas warabiya TaxID=1761012 RepID=A0A3G1KS94_FORW1|nr:sigma factor-like helix-turn-helix DNA-binding protein [Candidatus Formimonas warabiya]ATW25383.1 hypothetical protein DCMF_11925 [Candidatus Formimonas warabiya]